MKGCVTVDDWTKENGLNNVPSATDWDLPSTPNKFEAGGWHWGMTLVCLFTVTVFSFLMALLTKNIVNRPSWIIGAIFTVPTLGLFSAALLLERKTSAMTPNTSRKMQYFAALIAIVATFAVGCIFDLLYQHGTMDQIIKNWAVTRPPEKVYSDIVLMVDNSSSMEDDGKYQLNRKAIMEWLNSMGDTARVGVIVFNSGVSQKVPIGKLADNRQQIARALDVNTGGTTRFDISLYHAFRMIDDAENERTTGRTTQIIAITDAKAELPQEVKECFVSLAQTKDVAFSIVHLGQDVENDNPLMQLAFATGGTGTSIGVSDLSQYFESIQNAEEPDWDAYYIRLRTSGEVDFDLIRVSDPTANLLCGIMLGLEGLAIGICLMMMFSVTGQKRFQPIISVLMAVIAFVLLKVLGPGVGPVESNPRLHIPQWLLEGISFSLLGIVFMRKNKHKAKPNENSFRQPPDTANHFVNPEKENPIPDWESESSSW